jgi:predicted Zn-dependent protease
MDHAQKAREASPDFLDLDLADGMYNYWRTVVTMSSKMLPDFGDQRALGLAQLERVSQSGVFLADPANLALAFSWLEERDYKKAANACAAGRRKYPDNVINNLLSGQTYIQLRKYDEAIAIFNDIIEDAPDNNRVYYFMGLAYLRKDEAATAVQHLERYLASDVLEDWQQGTGHYRLGQAYYRLKSYAKAESHYTLAFKANGLKPAKAALDRMRDLKKAGKISY